MIDVRLQFILAILATVLAFSSTAMAQETGLGYQGLLGKLGLTTEDVEALRRDREGHHAGGGSARPTPAQIDAAEVFLRQGRISLPEFERYVNTGSFDPPSDGGTFVPIPGHDGKFMNNKTGQVIDHGPGRTTDR